MSAGAAYGAGIYMAANASTSFGYMSGGQTWEKTMLGKNTSIACIALCEGIVFSFIYDYDFSFIFYLSNVNMFVSFLFVLFCFVVCFID